MGENGYLTPKKRGESRFQEKKSLFLGHLCPVKNEAEAKSFIASIKKEFSDARHNVWAYSIHDGTVRCSDDGEPSGTGGAPVLETLTKKNVTDAALVVTRYFGGILLGTGGLVRAYSTAAADALADGGQVRVLPYIVGRVVCGYERYGRITRLLEKHGAKISGTDFEEKVSCRFLIKPENFGELSEEVSEMTCGELIPENLGIESVPVD